MDKIVVFADTLLGYIMIAGAIFAFITVVWYLFHYFRNIYVFNEDIRPVVILAMILSGEIACVVIKLLIHFLGWMWEVLIS